LKLAAPHQGAAKAFHGEFQHTICQIAFPFDNCEVIVSSYTSFNRTLARASMFVVVGAIIGAPAASAQTSGITEYPVPTAASGPSDMTLGADGNVWFVEATSANVSKISTAGVVTEFFDYSVNNGITSGPDGNLWCTTSGDPFGDPRFNPQIFATNTDGVGVNGAGLLNSSSRPLAITAGPDGNLWFTDVNVNNIGKVTLNREITEYPIPSTNVATNITSGPDGNLWFTEGAGNKIGKISVAGVVLDEFSIPTAGSAPGGIAVGADGNLWFTENFAPNIGKITPAGVITEYAIPSGNNANRITSGADGNLWFTETSGNQIGEINTAGAVLNEFSIPTAGSEPVGITSGSDGNLWFTEYAGNAIGRLDDLFRGGFDR
jgi:streptogramin lyase